MTRKNERSFRAVSFLFDRIEPGATATVHKTEEIPLRPARIVINPRDYDRGADFDGFAVDGEAYAVPPMVGNPTPLEGRVIRRGAQISLTIRNNGEHPVFPVAVVVMEIAEETSTPTTKGGTP